LFILNVLFYFVLQSTFYMNKDKALESVNEIKELMEKSSKFISVSGLPQSWQAFTHWLARTSRHKLLHRTRI